MSVRRRAALLLSLLSGFILASLMADPIAQNPQYHQFADTRQMAGIPFFLNVLSNVPFTIVGWIGMTFVYRNMNERQVFHDPREAMAWMTAFFGIALIGPGSAYYHIAPSNATLLWDRLPMAVGFMGLYAAVLAERVDVDSGVWLLPVLVILGVGSVVYWYFTEQAGAGDLRPYAVVQFFPLATIPVMLWLFPARYDGARYLWRLLILYGVAKGFEYGDAGLFDATGGFISGHTVKHLTAAIACWFLVGYLQGRVLPNYSTSS